MHRHRQVIARASMRFVGHLSLESRTISIFTSTALPPVCKTAYASFKRRIVIRLECVSSNRRLDSRQSILRRTWQLRSLSWFVIGNRLSGDGRERDGVFSVPNYLYVSCVSACCASAKMHQRIPCRGHSRARIKQ